ncbi:hypothetical protein [Catenulispora pinisilvae]|uniref:hypothetical protein n=1 Tax=Catenulispora pinisilvae TaxID=2705253 RepID=UPI001892761E|nr:hypothetical protein [Catenulispora pinisilvae]
MSTDTARTDAPITRPEATDLLAIPDLPTVTCEAFPPPRDLEQFRAASAAAEGDPVEEIDACLVRSDMTIWFPDPAPGRWRPVRKGNVAGPKTVIEFAVPPPYSSSWTLASDRPVCRRITSQETRLSSPDAESSHV